MDIDTLRTVRQGGRTVGKVRVDPLRERGKTHGFHIEYGDGRVEAVVRPETVRYKLSIREE